MTDTSSDSEGDELPEVTSRNVLKAIPLTPVDASHSEQTGTSSAAPTSINSLVPENGPRAQALPAVRDPSQPCCSRTEAIEGGFARAVTQPLGSVFISSGRCNANADSNHVSSTNTASPLLMTASTTEGGESSKSTTSHRHLGPDDNVNLGASTSGVSMRSGERVVGYNPCPTNRAFNDDERSRRCHISNELIDFSVPTSFETCISCGRYMLAQYAHLHNHCNACVTCHTWLETAPISHTDVCAKCGRQLCSVCRHLLHFC